MLVLSPHSANETPPHPLLGPKPESAASGEEMLSVPEFSPSHRCLGTGGDTAKSHFQALLGAEEMTQRTVGAGDRKRQRGIQRDGATEAEENSGGWQALLSAESDMAVGDR